MSARPKLLRTVGLTAAAYGLLALLAIELTLRTGGIALAWAATGMLVAVLATLRPRHWVPVLAAVFVASFAATYAVRANVSAATGFAIANVMEGAVVAGLLRRLGLHRSVLDSANSVLVFTLIAGVVGPAVTAPVAATTVLVAFGPGTALSTAMADWMLAHGLGNLIVGPLAYMAVHQEFAAGRRPGPRNLARFAAMIAGVGGVATLVFAQDHLPLLFLPALPMMVATVWLGRPGGAIALLAIAIPATVLTLSGHGPVNLMTTSAAFRLQFFQLYLATLFLMALPTAALLSRQRLLAATLRERETALRLLADHSSDVLLSLDVEGAIRFASPSVRVLGGYEPDALIGRNALELIEPQHRQQVERAHLDALADPDASFTVEHQGRRADGSKAWLETITRAIRDDDGRVTGAVSAIRDVSHRKAVERQLRLAADTDALTGLPNRRPFMAALDDAVVRAGSRPASIAMLDLDHFKQVNDRFGHAAGDAALVMIAELFRRELRGEDVVARLGGEEFGVLLRGVELTVAEATCERLRIAIARQPILSTGNPMFRVTASFGLAEVVSGSDAEAILEAADRALYAAKGAGRNQLSIAA